MSDLIQWQQSERVPGEASPRHEVALTVLDAYDATFVADELASRGVHLVTTGQVLRHCLRLVAQQLASEIAFDLAGEGDQ